ncbi:aminotransferase class I/II-fold pyridoxal phosphate-dependent enzyme [Dactylosporangium sp. CS-047395]|uniref:aminotransferase class I/II-fold pyridoxal phosphate-dependent enzyme n=1 Tax=Dactylosporangium sp. CS-047395 TaxID=3239936 RepID=UPI003D93B025
MFQDVVHVGRPNIGDRAVLAKRIDGALDRRWLTNGGPLLHEFEERVAQIAGTEHCVATSNATNGLQIAAMALGLQPGDQIIIPSFTWVATAHAMDWIGLVPVFCEVDEATGSADPAHVELLVGPRTKAILGVHVFGHPCLVEQLAKVAQRHAIPLLLDAAHAFGCTYQDRPIGGFGAAEVFSFHATKYVNSFEGGAIVTNDPDLAERARTMRTMGQDGTREVVGRGTVGRMSEVHAAMGLTSIEAMDDFIAINKRNDDLYRTRLAPVPGVTVRPQAAGERANYQYLVVEIDESVAGLHRDDVHRILHEHNVLSRKYFHPGCHEIEPYRSNPRRHAPLPLPRTEALTQRVLALPTGTSIGPAEVDGICEIIADAVATARRG